MPRPPTESEDDDLDELPPIDGDGEAEGPELDDVDVDDGDEGEESPLDDATGEGDPVDPSELDGDEAESGWLEEVTDAGDLDLGPPVLAELLAAEDESLAIDDRDEPAAADEDFGVEEGSGRSGLDFAEEGPVDEDDELRDEDLPALDADDGPDVDPAVGDESLLDERFAGSEPLALPWASEPWPRVGSPMGLASVGLPGGITALACAPRGVLVAGRVASGVAGVVLVDLEGTRQALRAEGIGDGRQPSARVVALAAEGELVAAVCEGGRLILSRDGGDAFEAVAVPEGVTAADIVLASRVLWVRTRTGSLLAARAARGLERCAVPGTVAALSGDGAGGVAALVVDETGRPATLVRGRKDGSVVCEALEGPSGRTGTLMTARKGHTAYASGAARGGIVVRWAGAAWQRVPCEGRLAGLALIDDAGTLVAAAYAEADDTTRLVRVDPAGRASLVAGLGAARDDAEADGRAVAMAWDDARGVVWVAGGFGIAAFATK
jgi:hypothetical protein